MNRRSFLSLPVVALSVSREFAQVERASQEPDGEYLKTIGWYSSMFRPIEELAAVIDRLRLLTYLHDLEQVCDNMIEDKHQIASELSKNRSLILWEDLRDLLQRLGINVNLTKRRVVRVTSILRDEFSKKGEGVSAELSDTLTSRKVWVAELEARMDSLSDAELSAFAVKAKKSEDALKVANSKLSDLIRFLDHGK